MTIKSVLLLIFGLVTPVCAQLKWEQPGQTFVPRLGEKKVTAKYRFTNASSSPVTVINIQPSCGCTTAKLAKKTYAPGESGEIDATFNFAGHVGHQEKWISVTTDLEGSEPTILSLAVDIPLDVTIRPEFVMCELAILWRQKRYACRYRTEFRLTWLRSRPIIPQCMLSFMK